MWSIYYEYEIEEFKMEIIRLKSENQGLREKLELQSR